MTKILIIDDDQAMQRIYQFGLMKEGFEVWSAFDAEEAKKLISERHYDIILLDMLLTGMSGLDFLKDYDIPTKSPGTKVVVLTNLDNPAIIAEVKAQPAVTAYLTKLDYEPPTLAPYLRTLT